MNIPLIKIKETTESSTPVPINIDPPALYSVLASYSNPLLILHLLSPLNSLWSRPSLPQRTWKPLRLSSTSRPTFSLRTWPNATISKKNFNRLLAVEGDILKRCTGTAPTQTLLIALIHGTCIFEAAWVVADVGNTGVLLNWLGCNKEDPLREGTLTSVLKGYGLEDRR